MDLVEIGTQMRLDALAVAVSKCLANQRVPHAVLKGPSTARWLYDPPRTFRDVDVLVSYSSLLAATDALVSARIARPDSGKLGEEASHALVLHAATGVEVDLHVTLPMLEVQQDDPDLVWRVLSDHVEEMALDAGPVQVLDVPGRCLVLALHALSGRGAESIPVQDLRAACETARAEEWAAARELARALGAASLFDAGLALALDEVDVAELPLEARLILGGQGGAFQLSRILRRPKREWPGVVAKELFPSADFMRRVEPGIASSRMRLAVAYWRRVRRLALSAPRQLRELRRMRSGP